MAFRLEAREGEWAVVSGATSGIGAEFARRLARQGYSLVLHGRREEQLGELAAELRQEHSVDCRIVISDFTEVEGIELLVQALRDCPKLAILVNNAGYGDPGLVQERSLQSMLEMLRVHDEAAVRLTHAAVPLLLANGRGAVVNIASVAAYLPGRGNVMYYATKAFLNAFSRALASDLVGTGIAVQSLCPGFTYTDFHDPGRRSEMDRSRVPRWMWMDVSDVVDCSLRRLGRGRVIVIPGIVNRIFAWIGGHPRLYWFIMERVRRK